MSFCQGVPFSCAIEVWTVLDSQKFLVRQRRNRVWGCAQLNVGIDKGIYADTFHRVLASLQSDVHFTMEASFKQGLPRVPVSTEREKELLERSLRHYQATRHLFETLYPESYPPGSIRVYVTYVTFAPSMFPFFTNHARTFLGSS